eukprot:2867545-Pyramimonas_sp.AAC.1
MSTEGPLQVSTCPRPEGPPSAREGALSSFEMLARAGGQARQGSTSPTRAPRSSPERATGRSTPQVHAAMRIEGARVSLSAGRRQLTARSSAI